MAKRKKPAKQLYRIEALNCYGEPYVPTYFVGYPRTDLELLKVEAAEWVAILEYPVRIVGLNGQVFEMFGTPSVRQSGPSKRIVLPVDGHLYQETEQDTVMKFIVGA